MIIYLFGLFVCLFYDSLSALTYLLNARPLCTDLFSKFTVFIVVIGKTTDFRVFHEWFICWRASTARTFITLKNNTLHDRNIQARSQDFSWGGGGGGGGVRLGSEDTNL